MNFLSNTDLSYLDHPETRALITAFIEAAEKRLRDLLTPTRSELFNYIFMPCPGYPQITGFRLEAGEAYCPHWPPLSSDAVLLELSTPSQEPWSVAIRLDPVALRIDFEPGDKVRVYHGDDQVATMPTAALLTLTLRRIDGRLWLNISGRRLLDLGISDPVQLDRIAVQVEAGATSLIQLQAFAGDLLLHRHFDAGDPERRVELAPTSPRWVLQWERRAKYFYHTAIMAKLAHEILVHRPEMLPDGRRIASRLERNAAEIWRALHLWPYWRPGGLRPENGPWDRNNWANGYLPGTYAVLGQLGQLGRQATAQTLLAKFNEAGTSWLLHLHELEQPHAFRFPDHRHWLVRSTNHGLVIYFSYLLGTKLLQEDVRTDHGHVWQECERTLSQSLSDGCYPEGFEYLQFVLIEALPLIWLSAKETGSDWHALIERDFSALLPLPALFANAARTDGPLLAAFGDCGKTDWIYSCLRLVAGLSPRQGDLKALLKAAAGPLEPGNEYLPLALALPQPSQPIPEPPTVHMQATDYARCGMASAGGQDGEGTPWRLWACGSQLHRTHNLDYDAGSFFLERAGTLWIGEIPGRAAWCHSGWLMIGQHLVDPEDPTRTAGDVGPGGVPLPRSSSGTVETQWLGSQTLLLTQRNPRLLNGPDGPLFRDVVRQLVVSLTPRLSILVVDWLTVTRAGEVAAQFLSPALAADAVRLAVDEHRVAYKDIGSLLIAPQPGQWLSHHPMEKCPARVLHHHSQGVPGLCLMARALLAGNVDGAQLRLTREGDIATVSLTWNGQEVVSLSLSRSGPEGRG